MPLVCAQCGQENPDGFRFCGACGAPLVEAPAPREVRKIVTVLFADVVGSTALGEARDPEAVRAQMGRWFEQARAIVEGHGGRVEKFVGDAVMAVFGIPQSHEDDALRAVRAAVELRDADTGVELRIGVNTGSVVTGQGETLVTGDAVNVAARLEQAAAPGEVLVGAQTLGLVRDAVEIEAVEPLELKGKSAPVEAYRLVRIDPDAAGLARHLDSPLVGRTRELQRLRDDFAHAVSGRTCQMFTLLGPAGVGKSRLVSEFLAGADARVVHGRCLHYGEGITYFPLVETLLQLGLEPDAVIGSTPADTQLAYRRLLEREAAKQPLVVLFDDLHWAEPTFLDLVEHIADLSRDAPIFLLCVARPELLDVRPAWGGGKLNATVILLESLDETECTTLIDNLLGSAAMTEATRGRILAAADGNPLYVEEMIAMVREDGDGSGEIAVPPTIHALLQARIDRLGADERSVIERGAVEGKVFHRGPVAELTTAAVRADLDGHLAKLVRKELIRPETSAFAGDDAYRFRHLLIRDAAYESLPKETRAELHERFADWLEARAELVEQDEIIGYHLEQALLYRRELGREDAALAERASARLAAAGHGALNRGEYDVGSALLGRAVPLLSPLDPARPALLPELVFALIHSARYEDARTSVEELAAATDVRAQTYATLFEAELALLTGRTRAMDETRSQIAAARAVFEEVDDPFGLALCSLLEGNRQWMLCQAGKAAVAFERAADDAERADARAIARQALSMLGACLMFGPMPVAEAEAKVEKLRQRAGGGALADADAARRTALAHTVRGDFAGARELYEGGLAVAREAGLRVNAAGGRMGRATIELHAGDVDAAVAGLRTAVQELEELGDRAYYSTAAMELAHCLLLQGRYDEAREWCAAARERTQLDDVVNLAGLDAVEGVLLARAGDVTDGEALARSGLERADETDFWSIRGLTRKLLAEVLRLGDDHRGASALLEEAARIYDEKGDVVYRDRARELIAELVR